MKTLVITEYYNKVHGGGELNLKERIKAMRKKGYDVNVLEVKTGKDPSSLLSNIKRAIIFPKSILKHKTSFKFYDRIYLTGNSVIVADKIDNPNTFAIIESLQFFCPKSDLLHLGIECKQKCSFIRFLHCQMHSEYFGKMKHRFWLKLNPIFLLYIWWRYRKLNKALKHCKLITISKYMQNLLLKFGHKSIIEPNIIPKSFSSVSPTVRGVRGKLKVICLGSLLPYRGFHILLEAVKNLNVKLEIYGNGPMYSKLQQKIADYNINGKIKPSVPYKEVPQVIAKADVVVVPSLLPEPEGRVAREAIIMKKKLIVSDIGALSELDTIKVQPNNVEDLRNEIKKVCSC